MKTTTYKGYTIRQHSDRNATILKGDERITTIVGSLSCCHYYIDEYCEPIQPEPTDPYEGLDLSEDLPDSEVVNEALGLTTDPFMELLDRTKDQQSQDDRKGSSFESKMLSYWDEYDERKAEDIIEEDRDFIFNMYKK